MISAPIHGRRIAAWAVAVTLLVPALAQAQVRQALYQPGGQQGQPARRANHWTSGGSEWTNAYGEPVVIPASYCGDGCTPGGMMGYNGMGGCCTGGAGPYPHGAPNGVQMQQPAGGWPGQFSPYAQECEDPCDGRRGLLGKCCFLGLFDAGLMRPIDQCGPHYFDFSAEALYWKRNKPADPEVIFATIGVTDVSAGVDPALALTTNDVEGDWEPGLRLTGRYDLGALSFLEVSYAGLFEWGAVSTLDGAGDIFTGYSNFGLGVDTTGDGVPNIGVDGAGLSSTELANSARLELLSELHNSEISYRRYWVGFNPRVSGTVMAGVRYTRLSEDLNFSTLGPAGSSWTAVRTENDLVGFQAGGDMWVTVRQGCRIGGYGKAGIYNNRCEVATSVTGSALPGGTALENVKADHVSFIGEGGVSIVADILPSWSLRAGYDVLFINTAALAANNFDFYPTVFLGETRNPTLYEESSALYHGANLGLEFVW
ncbi:hypothetical protein NG895_21880 [Aeoliella sp. ICT_H6.2]|uniref:Uncharacterized protein n=1 Tax=Aeoliella straminimaris TaxID=2954799 RepID=A0A9X2JI69_9BACT|nr:hypothetical protein [Aeoliella straminimaris]MCO6046556.1 hypothetical protein [Aeoliella straminimaris]